MKIHAVGAELLQTDRHKRMDRHDATNSRFSKFCERALKASMTDMISKRGILDYQFDAT
jgi:hypothetical protein